jgi:class 3 adenylate cyclase
LFLLQLPRDLGGVEIRVGLNYGEVYGALIGRARFRYHLFGEPVNVANYMESNSEPGRVLCSAGLVRQLRRDHWQVSAEKTVHCGQFGDYQAAFVSVNHKKRPMKIQDVAKV